ncbi:MAG: DUF1549 domain-containing protein, partial [Verrucomicrobiaceae bacterium]
MFENHLRPTHRETHAPAMWLLFLGVALCPVVKLTAAEATKFPPDQIEFFEKKIRPLLSNRCYKCHSAGAEKIKGELLLDSRAAAIKGGEKGPGVVPGNLEKSLLIEAIHYENQDLQMPPKSKLSDAEIADLTTWVGQGAPWPEEAPPARTAGPVKKVFDLEDRKRKHWCWEPLNKTTPPTPKNAEWSSSAIDRFVLAKLEEKNLRPAPAADAATLLRRLCFDITGLPAKPEEVEAFVSSYAKDPKATLESKVDSLLASPAFGERWSRHWLDLVRYAESRGHEFDPLIPNAYQYRD